MPPIDTSYEEALRFLTTFTNFSKFHTREAFETVATDIRDFRMALRTLEEPHLQYSVIHVAGSKGKGSTCNFIASCLEEAGFKTGLHTSPHLIDIVETVRVNGKDISREEYGRLIARLREVLPDGGPPVHEEALRRLTQRLGLRKPPKEKRHAKNVLAYETGVALLHFANEKVDFGVIETGMGGRLDHTNVFDTPPGKAGDALVTVITTMALEHKMPLGETIAEIAEHKAGVIQKHGLTVLGPQKPEWYADVRKAIDARCGAIGAPAPLDVNTMIKVVPGSENFTVSGCDAEYRCDALLLEWARMVAPENQNMMSLLPALQSGLRISTRLAGGHQAENIRSVIGNAVALQARGFDISPEQLAAGILKTRWAARFEILSDDPLIIVDCCHEALSIEAFGKTFQQFYGDRPAIGLMSFLRDNDIPAMCIAAKKHLSLKHVVCCKADVAVRSLEASEAIALAQPYLEAPMSEVPDQLDALRAAYDMRQGNEALLIFGDFYIAGNAREMIPKWLGREQ